MTPSAGSTGNGGAFRAAVTSAAGLTATGGVSPREPAADWLSHWPAAVLGLVVFAFGAWQADAAVDVAPMLVVAAGMGVAAGLYRAAPGAALALVWATAVAQVVEKLDVALVQVAALIVSYGAARYGHVATVWLSGLSIPAGAALALAYLSTNGTSLPYELGLSTVEQVASVTTVTAGFILAVTVLAGPWVLGLVLRLMQSYRRSTEDRKSAEAEAVRARDIAELRADQARLARDVHDVVGHSLTVIVAQADSAQSMDDADIAGIRSAMANIATSARRSLGDVRNVLSATLDGGTAVTAAPGELDSLLDGVRAAGNDVRSHVEGVAQPLPPELGVVAYRVLQEMLTNALKHGRRGAAVDVVRSWTSHHLVIEVRNAVADDAVPADDGVGLPGMQRRLDAVGGRLDVHLDDSPATGGVFASRAWIPLRPPRPARGVS